MKKKLRVIKKIANVLCWILIIAIVATVSLSLISRINGQVPSIFGYSIFRVSSGSMEPELMVGDIILDKKVDSVDELKVGEVITFRSEKLGSLYVTHKIIKAPYKVDGKLMLQTQGVANNLADSPISTEDVQGIMVCKIDFLNTVYDIFLSPWGLLILIGLIIIIFLDEIIVVAKILTNNDNSKADAENINDIIERLQREKSDNQSSKSDADDSNGADEG